MRVIKSSSSFLLKFKRYSSCPVGWKNVDFCASCCVNAGWGKKAMIWMQGCFISPAMSLKCVVLYYCLIAFCCLCRWKGLDFHWSQSVRTLPVVGSRGPRAEPTRAAGFWRKRQTFEVVEEEWGRGGDASRPDSTQNVWDANGQHPGDGAKLHCFGYSFG